MECDYEHYGLNKWARELVGAKQVVKELLVRRYPDGREERFNRQVAELSARRERIGELCGCGVQLYRYILPNGEVYEEFEQYSFYWGWGVSFVALRDVCGNVVAQSLWSDEQTREPEPYGKCG